MGIAAVILGGLIGAAGAWAAYTSDLSIIFILAAFSIAAHMASVAGVWISQRGKGQGAARRDLIAEAIEMDGFAYQERMERASDETRAANAPALFRALRLQEQMNQRIRRGSPFSIRP